MTEMEMKMKLQKLGFCFDTEAKLHIAEELIELKAEGAALPDDKAALEKFTAKWNAWCAANTMWHEVDQLGYKMGLWA